MNTTISLFLPLPHAWSARPDQEAWARLVLKRSAGDAFETLSIGTTLKDDLAPEPSALQRRIARTTDATLTLTLRRTRTTGTDQIDLKATDLVIGPLALGQTRKAAEDTEDFDVLLQGSLVIPTVSLSVGDEGALQDWLGPLWPTGDLKDVTHLRIEPDGLYLQGTLPDALFADATLDDRVVVLRVPQLAKDVLPRADDLALGQKVDTRHKGQFWSITSFQFPDPEPSIDSQAFVRGHAEDFRVFRLQANGSSPVTSEGRRSDTFIDNIVAAPPPECVVRIFRDDSENALEWEARPPGVRLVIAAGRSEETTFFPRALTGRLETQRDSFVRDTKRPVQFESGDFALVSGKPPIRLVASISPQGSQVEFEFPPEEMVALSVPSVPSPPPDGPPPLPERKGDLGPDAPREPVRNWICTSEGWLQLDAEQPVSPPPPGLAERDVSGVLPLDRLRGELLRALNPNSGDEATAGLEVRVEALADGHIAVALERDESDGKSLRLELYGARTTVLTPRVWFAPRSNGPATLRDAIPSLTAAALDDEPRDNAPQPEDRGKLLQARLDDVLQVATFITAPWEFEGNPDKEQARFDRDAPYRRRLYAMISWERVLFRIGFPADRLVAWQRPTIPVVTNYPLTPPSDGDGSLDANRGLIPFVRSKQNAATDPDPQFVQVGFPQRGLPRLLAAPFPRKQDDGWKPARETRVFLPTLPGLEATVDALPTDWTWIYRHAVPALDEAYAEARETDDDPAVFNPGGRGPDLTRVEGAVAFTVDTASETQASGWLPFGTTTVYKATTEGLETANPSLSFRLGDVDSDPITFNRQSGVAELSAQLSFTFNDGERPTFAFNDTALKPVSAEKAVEMASAVIHNGQPMLTQWSKELGVVVSLDGDGLMRAEPSFVRSEWSALRAWPSGESDPIVRMTARLLLKAGNTKHWLDLVGVSVGPLPKLDDLGLERWSWWQEEEGGKKGWPTLVGFPLYPLQLVRLDADGTVILRAVLLPRPPDTKADPLHAPGFAAGAVELTFSPTNSAEPGTVLELTQVNGVLDWRFPTPPDVPESEPRAERLRAGVELKSGSESLALTIQEVAVRHEVGLFRLVPSDPDQAEGSIEIDSGLRAHLEDEVRPTIEADEARFNYEFKLQISPPNAPNAPNEAEERVPQCKWEEYIFSWSSELPKMEGSQDRLTWKLVNRSGIVSTPQPSWLLQLSRGTAQEPPQVLVRGTVERPHRIGACDLLLKITESLQPSPDNPESSWFRSITTKNMGFAAVTFKAGGNNGTVPLPTVFASEIPLSFVGRTADRTIQIYDPKDDTFQTLDRDTESISLDSEGLPSEKHNVRLANASLAEASQHEIIFSQSGDKGQGQLFLMDTSRNVVVPKSFIDGVKTRAMTVMRQGSKKIAVTVDESENVWAWDLRTFSAPKSGSVTLDQPLGRNPQGGSQVSALAGAPPQSSVEIVAWARTSEGKDAGVYVWDLTSNRFAKDDDDSKTSNLLLRINPHIDNLDPMRDIPPIPNPLEASPITAIAISNNEHLISGAHNGSLRVWRKDRPLTKLPVVYQKMKHGEAPITAVAQLAITDQRIVSADKSGMIKIWPWPDTTSTEPLDLVQVVTAQYEINHGEPVNALIPLGFKQVQDTEKPLFAVLDSKGTVTIYEVLLSPSFRGEATVFNRERLDTRGAFIRSIAAMPTDDDGYCLLLDGFAQPSRLEGVLRAAKDNLSIEVSGRLTSQDAIDFEDASLSGAKCTHRVDLRFDRAPFPLESLFRGEGPRQPLSFGAVVEHTFRFAGGTERVWQTPQVVRFMRTADFNSAYERIQPANDELVIDAGAVHWLQWVEGADREPGGAASVSNDRLRILLRPRQVGRMQRGVPLAVRLPTVVINRDQGAPSLGLVLNVPDARDWDPDNPIAFNGSGAQPIQPPPASLSLEDLGPPHQARTDQADSVAYLDRATEAAWLDERFLHGLLIPRRTTDAANQPPTGPVSPILSGTDLALDSVQDWGDLAWLRLKKRPSHLPKGGDLLSLGPISLRRLQPQLAAATVANKHRPGGPDSALDARLDGPTLVEFPFDVKAEAAQRPTIPASFQDVQIVTFEGGRFRRLARVQLPSGSDPDPQLVTWASNWRAARGRPDALLLLVNLTKLEILPRSFQSGREDCRAAWPWEVWNVEGADYGLPIPEPRCVPPGAISAGLEGDTKLSLTVFGASPVGPYPANRPVKGVAATRFRLAPSLADDHSGGGRLCAAQVKESETLAFSALDDVRFAAQSRLEGEGRPYPSPDPGALARRPDPAIPRESDSDAASLLPPLLDVVAWASRPGEQTSTTWGLRRLGKALGPVVRTSLRRPRAKPGAQETVRLNALDNPVIDESGRFCEQAFQLSQVIDMTRFDDDDRGVYAVLTTRSELFRSSPKPDVAKTGPARVYTNEPWELTLIAKAEGIPGVVTRDDPNGVKKVTTAGPYLLFIENGQEPINVLDDRRILIDAPPSEGWKRLGDENPDFYLRTIHVPDKLPDAFEIRIMMFSMEPPPLPDPLPDELPPLKPNPEDVRACLMVNRLDPKGRFQAPKMSIALLVRTQDTDPSTGPYRLSGYGRLGDADFTPIRPGPGLTSDEVQWSRSAGLWTLDRIDARDINENADSPFAYEVVVYGPGGEMIPTMES
jgi:hypothetical protein